MLLCRGWKWRRLNSRTGARCGGGMGGRRRQVGGGGGLTPPSICTRHVTARKTGNAPEITLRKRAILSRLTSERRFKLFWYLNATSAHTGAGIFTMLPALPRFFTMNNVANPGEHENWQDSWEVNIGHYIHRENWRIFIK